MASSALTAFVGSDCPCIIIHRPDTARRRKQRIRAYTQRKMQTRQTGGTGKQHPIVHNRTCTRNLKSDNKCHQINISLSGPAQAYLAVPAAKLQLRSQPTFAGVQQYVTQLMQDYEAGMLSNQSRLQHDRSK